MEIRSNEIIWEAEEYEHREKTPLWLMTSLVVAFAGLVIALWQKNFLFAVFILFAEIMVLEWGNRQPEVLQFAVDHDGVHISDHKSHPYQALTHFAFTSSPYGITHLVLANNSKIHPYIKVPVPHDGVEQIRTFISQHLEEKNHEEVFSDVIARFIGF